MNNQPIIFGMWSPSTLVLLVKTSRFPCGEMVAAPAIIHGMDETIYNIMLATTKLSNKMSMEDNSVSFDNPFHQQ